MVPKTVLNVLEYLEYVSSLLGDRMPKQNIGVPISTVIDAILLLAIQRKAAELRFEVTADNNLDVCMRTGDGWSALPALDCTDLALPRLLIVAGLSIIPDDRRSPQIGWARIHSVSMVFETEPLARLRENLRVWIDWKSARPWLVLKGIRRDADPLTILTRADAFADQGRYDEAALLCDQVLSEYSDCAAAFNLKGFCLDRAGSPAESILFFKLALRYLPVHPLIRFNLGASFEAAGDFGGTLAEYNEALRLDIGFFSARVARATLRYQLRDFEGSIVDLNECIRAAPGDAYAYLARAMCHLEAKHFVRADADMRQAVWLDANLMVEVDELKSRFPRA